MPKKSFISICVVAENRGTDAQVEWTSIINWQFHGKRFVDKLGLIGNVDADMGEKKARPLPCKEFGI